MWLNCFITLHVLIPGIRRVKCSHLYFCLLHGRFPAWGCHGFHPLHHLKVPLAWGNLQPVIKNNSIKPLPLADPGEGPGGLIQFLNQTEAPPPLSNGLDDRPLISRSGCGNDYYHFQSGAKRKHKTVLVSFICSFIHNCMTWEQFNLK